MRIISDNDKILFNEISKAFNSDDVRTVLIRGFDDDDKLFIALNAAISLSKTTNPQLRINGFKHVTELVNRTLREYGRSKVHLTSTKPVFICGQKFSVDRWDQNEFSHVHPEISIYYPIQSVLLSSEVGAFNKLNESLSNDHSKLRILITTNDYATGLLNINWLSNIVDQTLVLDSSKKYPETYAAILANLGIDKLNYEDDE